MSTLWSLYIFFSKYIGYCTDSMYVQVHRREWISELNPGSLWSAGRTAVSNDDHDLHISPFLPWIFYMSSQNLFFLKVIFPTLINISLHGHGCECHTGVVCPDPSSNVSVIHTAIAHYSFLSRKHLFVYQPFIFAFVFYFISYIFKHQCIIV